MRSILVGNYGVGNVGDEALKEYFLQAFPDNAWTVLSAHPKDGELPRLPAGFHSFVGLSWLQTLQAFRKTDVVVFGGGSLFTDVESTKACWIWFVHAFVAYIFQKPYLLAFQGIGPCRSWWGTVLTRWVVRHAAFVSVRDEESGERADAFLKNKKCVRTFDPVVLLLKNGNINRTNSVITLIPRHNSSTAFLDAVREVLKRYPVFPVSILLMQPESKSEQHIAKELQQLAGERSTIVPVLTMHALSVAIAQSSVVLTERYHGALAALALHVPVRVIALAAGDKLSMLQPYADGTRSFEEVFEQARAGEEALRMALAQA